MFRKLGIVIIGLFILLSLLPYLIPITKPAALEQTPFENSSFAMIEGLSIHYRTWYQDGGDHPTGKVVFLHGLGGSTFSWRNNIDSLVDAGYFVVAADLPGFGYSERKRGIDHSQDKRAEILWSLLLKLEQDERLPYLAGQGWHLVGHSMGGGTITAMAALKPEQTQTVIYVSPAVFSGGNPRTFITKYPPFLRWIEVVGRHVLINERRVEAFLTSAYGRPPKPYEVQGYLEPLRLPGTESVLGDLEETSTRTTVADLQKLEMPVAAIWGELDSWIPVEDALLLNEILPHLKLKIIENSYHCPMETDADRFNAALLKLLQD